MMKIKIILGSTRPNRFSEHAGAWIYEIAKQRNDMDLEVLDLRDYPMPFYDEPISPSYILGDYPNPIVDKWAKKIAEADGFIFVTPEYNRGTSGVLKNALDSVFKEWNHKAIAFVGYGSVGGARAIEQLRTSAIEAEMFPTRHAVHIFAPWTLVEEGNKLKPGVLDPYVSYANTMLENLAYATDAMKQAREKKGL
jgi:NAD(P)H-dependent FMN reductase